jgi:hypothetical protein
VEVDSLAESATNVCTCAGATAVLVLVSVVMTEGLDGGAGWQLVVQCFAIVEAEVRRLSSRPAREGAKNCVDPLSH